MYKTRSISAAEAFLLQINFTNICLFISILLFLLFNLNVINFPFTLYMLFYSPSFTARPIFLLAMCMIIYQAMVHPVTFMATKTWFHWEWLVITLIWIYTLVVNVAIVFNKYNYSYPVFVAMFLISLPITMYFNITAVRALISRGPGNDNQTLNPAKRKAFRIILSIQLVLLMIYVPRTYYYVHDYIAPMDGESPTLTARPIFLLAMCVIFYLAIVHPVTYMTAKTWLHWEWLVVSLGWIYAMAVNVAVIVHEISIFDLIFTVLFYNTYFLSIFFNIATLRALSSSKPGIGGTLDLAKRKAFRIILGILVLLLLYYVPRVYYFVYPFIAPMDLERFMCAEGSVIMVLPKVSELSMPAIFLYSLHKLGVSSKADN
ncbi:hypothetical protein KOW79_001320 [Hemibagrus wyckioides]|uniref:G-protein coupled receptors family 1 profile domain-containing protein n=1 Tax=Hemibagrus wyckioides TaxID=337641 RepID=A0A9D3P718_9TELE|nr:hypothetical protein KOW79_001320 [Hemibagrus wyckioides]